MPMIVQPHAISHKWTVVVEPQHALATNIAVLGPRSLPPEESATERAAGGAMH